MARRRRVRPEVKSPYDRLEAATTTLAKERKFFDALVRETPVALVVNRIIHLATFFKGAESWIPPYLERHATQLFQDDALHVAATLAHLLAEISRSARLAAYLCVKGLPDEALVLLRASIEQLGVYTHIWHQPAKYRFVPDSDSEEFTKAFRSPRDHALARDLKVRGVRFRFLHCKAAKALSDAYSLLSAHVVHGSIRTIGRMPELSCDFVDRASPQSLSTQYNLVQAMMALVYSEIFASIPKDDWLCDELAALSIASAVLLPVLSSLSDEVDPKLKDATDSLLRALGEVRWVEDDSVS